MTRVIPSMSIRPDVVEDLGAESHVIFTLDAPRVSAEAVRAAADLAEGDEGKLFADDRAVFTACLDTRGELGSGVECEVAVDHTRFHFFDPATGLTLDAGAPGPQAVSGGQPLAALGVEEVRLRRARPQVRRARRGPAHGGVSARATSSSPRRRARRAEDVGVGAELLDDLDARRHAVGGELERLGPQPTTTLDQPPRRRCADDLRHGELDPAERHRPPFSSGTVQRFIAGEPMKPATNMFAGRS